MKNDFFAFAAKQIHLYTIYFMVWNTIIQINMGFSNN